MARAALGIETEGPVLMAAAQNLSERRKGGTILVDALRAVSSRPLTLVTLGSGRLQVEDNGLSVHSLGYVDQEYIRVLAYNAADLFVHAAPVDNLPNVVMEAIACGTPVVGFPIGGVPEMVRPGITGWLAEGVSSNALAKTIDGAINDLNRCNWRKSCRAVARADYRMEQQARRYIELFASMRTTSNDRSVVDMSRDSPVSQSLALR
jgi:glycosyltransferase involved in cell wall biosynthesis